MANTVKVRIAVAVTGSGEWGASGNNNKDDYDNYISIDRQYSGTQHHVYFIEADLPIPEIQTIQAKVSEQ